MSEPRIIFAGTPEFAAKHLKALLDANVSICAIYTQPDRPAGRGRKLQKSPVKRIAEEAGIAVHQPASLRDPAAQGQLRAIAADLMIVVAYGQILPQSVLDTPRLGCVNVHASLLPRWRGAAPIHRALLDGDQTTGVTLMQMEAGLDTGPMLAKVETPIKPTETSGQLQDRLASLGAEMLVRQLPDLLAERAKPERQTEAGVTYAHKLEKQEGLIDWSGRASDIYRQVRGLNPWPVAYTDLDGETLRIWRAEPIEGISSQPAGTLVRADRSGIDIACGTGSLRLLTVQLPGKKATEVSAILNSNSHPFSIGKRLGTHT